VPAKVFGIRVAVVTLNAPILHAEIIKRALVPQEKRQKINKAGVRVSFVLSSLAMGRALAIAWDKEARFT